MFIVGMGVRMGMEMKRVVTVNVKDEETSIGDGFGESVEALLPCVSNEPTSSGSSELVNGMTSECKSEVP